MNRREKDITKKPLDDWITTSDEIEDEDKDESIEEEESKVCSKYALRIL